MKSIFAEQEDFSWMFIHANAEKRGKEIMMRLFTLSLFITGTRSYGH
jgi:hypothetical protein